MIYAYFGGLSADKRTTYELVLSQRAASYTLTSALRSLGRQTTAAGLWGWLCQQRDAPLTRQLYAGTDLRRALLILLQSACAANLAELGQRFCYVLPSVPSQPGALAALLPNQLRHDNSLPLHPQLWQAGRPLDTLPAERHAGAGHEPGARRDAPMAADDLGRARSSLR